jgi:hypothetical protein
MSEARSQLQAVPPEGEPSDLQAAVAPPERRSRRHALVWALAVGLVGSAVGWAFEAQQNQELVVSLEATSVALLEARAELSAWEGHAGLAREQAEGQVDSLLGRRRQRSSLGPAPPPARGRSLDSLRLPPLNSLRAPADRQVSGIVLRLRRDGLHVRHDCWFFLE